MTTIIDAFLRRSRGHFGLVLVNDYGKESVVELDAAGYRAWRDDEGLRVEGQTVASEEEGE